MILACIIIGVGLFGIGWRETHAEGNNKRRI